jgi:hypothetical protein
VRTAALVNSQSGPTRQRIRAAFDRSVSRYATDHGLELLVSVKLGSGRRPGASG